MTKEIKEVPIKLIIALIGNIFVVVAPLFCHVAVKMVILKETIYEEKYNMWKVLSPEAGGATGNNGAGFWGFVPTLLMILGILGIIFTLLQIVKDIDNIAYLQYIIPVLAIVLFILFETVGMKTFHDFNKDVLDAFNKTISDGKYAVTRGIGFYAIIVGLLANVVSLFYNRLNLPKSVNLPTANPSNNVYDELERIAKLHEQGIVSEEDYNKMKNGVLSRYGKE